MTNKDNIKITTNFQSRHGAPSLTNSDPDNYLLRSIKSNFSSPCIWIVVTETVGTHQTMTQRRWNKHYQNSLPRKPIKVYSFVVFQETSKI